MPDFDAISAALTARFAPGTMSPPSGLGAVRGATDDPPNNVTALPTVIVFPDNGEYEYMTSTRQGSHVFRVQLLYSQGIDIARDTTPLRKWAQTLCDQLKASAQLGGIVDVARVASWRLVKITYAGEDFTGVELAVDIVKTEPWAATA